MHSRSGEHRRFGLAERLEHVRARGAHRGVVHRELVLEQLLRGDRLEAPHALLGLGDGEHLDERPLADTQREAGVAGRDEPEQADAVHRAAPRRLGFEQAEREPGVDHLVGRPRSRSCPCRRGP